MVAPRVLDQDALHRYLYDNSNRFHQITVHQLDLARALMVDKDTLNMTLKRMVDAAQLELVKKGYTGINTYQVINPYQHEQAKPKGKIMWQ